jgi:hypothetical protein
MFFSIPGIVNRYWSVGPQSFCLFPRGVRSEVGKLVCRLAEKQFLIRRSMVGLFTGEQALRVDIVSILRHLQILMDPVPVLLNHVTVELVGRELGCLPPGIHGTAPPGTHTGHSQVSEVLEELGFIDLANTVPADGDEVSADPVGVEEEHGAEGPYGEGTQEGVGLDVAL